MSAVPCFCGMDEGLLAMNVGGLRQWPRGVPLSWFVDRSIRVAGWERDALSPIVEASLGTWAAVADLRFERATRESRANIVVRSRNIDVRHGTLAEAQLPFPGIGADGQLQVWLDTGEHWVNARNMPGSAVDLLRVLIHEFGHTLGVGHLAAPAIMESRISNLRAPQPNDVQEMVDRYGPPGSSPPDDDCLRWFANWLRDLNADERAVLKDLANAWRPR